MSDAWRQLEGQTVDGKFRLVQFLGGSERGAVFLTERREGDRLLKAAVKLVPAAGNDDEPQWSRWRLASDLSHPHLISLYEWGRCEMGDAPLLYILMEYAEENLGQILPSRALTAAEARLMLDPVVNALGYLHGKGLVHGGIKPANILAQGDVLKVSSDGLCREGAALDALAGTGAYDPPEYARGVFSAGATVSPAGDVWSLGMTLVESLSQHLPVPAQQTAGQQAPRIPEDLPEPFLDIARHCLVWHPQGRWTIAQIAARLRGDISVSQARPAARPPKPAVRPVQRVAKRRGYLAAIGVGLALAAIFAGMRLLRHRSETPKTLAVAPEQPARNQETQEPPARLPGESLPNDTAAGQPPAGNVPPAVSVARETSRNEGLNSSTKGPADATVRGGVVRQVLPDVSKSALDTIQGTVRVSVTVDVDRSGNVDAAELESPGPSKYFAAKALQAAQLWKFQPPKVAGQPVLSHWTLRFEFTSGGTTVLPAQQSP